MLRLIIADMEVEVHICPLLEFICCNLWLFMPLEPSVVLFVIPPRLLFQLSGSQILLVCVLHIYVLFLEREVFCIY